MFALALLTLVGACGRVGYEAIALPATHDGDGDVEIPRDGGPDQAGPRPEPPRDGAAEPGDGPPAGADPRPDGALPVDMRPLDITPPPADMAPPPVDMALPIDTTPPRDGPPDTGPAVVDMSPATSPCTSFPPGAFPAGDLIADFEDGSLRSNQVGSRGGTVFHVVDETLGTIANVPQSYCGLRALQVQRIGSTSKAVLVQGRLMPGASSTVYDATAYRGISLGVRTSTSVAVRVKLPNADTLQGGYDHFVTTINASTGWQQVNLTWADFQQSGTGTQFPGLDVSELWGVEFSVTLPAGATLWVDNVGFVR